MSNKKRLPVSLEPKERAKLERLAQHRGLSLARMVAQLIREVPEPEDPEPAPGFPESVMREAVAQSGSSVDGGRDM